jgi:uncharacterized damage-inducible protein DinB
MTLAQEEGTVEDGKWKHLFVEGEYASPSRILSGLTLDQVNRAVSEQSHTIYDELWHTTTWQGIVVQRDEERYREWQAGNRFPAEQPRTFEEWLELVDLFLSGLDEVLELASSPKGLKVEVEPGTTMEDVLHSLAVHNTYHLGKIVALRQMMGAWPP